MEERACDWCGKIQPISALTQDDSEDPDGMMYCINVYNCEERREKKGYEE